MFGNKLGKILIKKIKIDKTFKFVDANTRQNKNGKLINLTKKKLCTKNEESKEKVTASKLTLKGLKLQYHRFSPIPLSTKLGLAITIPSVAYWKYLSSTQGSLPRMTRMNANVLSQQFINPGEPQIQLKRDLEQMENEKIMTPYAWYLKARLARLGSRESVVSFHRALDGGVLEAAFFLGQILDSRGHYLDARAYYENAMHISQRAAAKLTNYAEFGRKDPKTGHPVIPVDKKLARQYKLIFASISNDFVDDVAGYHQEKIAKYRGKLQDYTEQDPYTGEFAFVEWYGIKPMALEWFPNDYEHNRDDYGGEHAHQGVKL